jgi:hypothetical protein
MLTAKKNWPEPVALTSAFSVELPGLETDALPGKMHSGLLFRYVSFPFSPARYLRFRFRISTASRVVLRELSMSGGTGPRKERN